MNKKNIKTWSCDNCGYSQDFEPTKANFDIHFNNDGDYLGRMRTFNGRREVMDGECPSCKLKGISKKLHKEVDESKKTVMKFLEDHEIDALILHGDELKTSEAADSDDIAEEKEHIILINTKEGKKAIEEGKQPNFKSALQSDPFIPKQRRNLTPAEKKILKDKRDINWEKYKHLEDK